jgi:hypothetical protein
MEKWRPYFKDKQTPLPSWVLEVMQTSGHLCHFTPLEHYYLPFSCGPFHSTNSLPNICYQYHCSNVVFLLFPKLAGWPTVPTDASSHPLHVSLFLSSRSDSDSSFLGLFFPYVPWPTFFPLSFLPKPFPCNRQAYLFILQGWVSLYSLP